MFRLDSLAVRNFALIYAQAEAAIGIGTGPRFKNHRSALLPVIRERNQCAIIALLALRQLHHHASLAVREPAPNATYLTIFPKSMRHLAGRPPSTTWSR